MSVRRLFVASLAALCAMVAIAFTATAALAAAPEAPETAAARKVSSTTAVLDGFVDPHSEASVGAYFAYSKEGNCVGGAGTPLQPETTSEHHEVSAEVNGLIPNTTYTACLVARNAEGETAVGNVVSFTTATVAPSVDDEYMSEGGLTSVRLNSLVNTYGLPARYRFELGTTEALGTSTSEQMLAPAYADFRVSVPIAGLSTDTRYYARVVAESEAGTTAGVLFTFLTLPSGSASLPDGRVYEMVTPVQNGDADIYAPLSVSVGFGTLGEDIGTPSPFQVAEDGEAVTYVGDPVEDGNGSGGASLNSGNQFFARRTAAGWQQEVIAATGGDHSYYEAFSPDLSVGILHAGNGYGEDTALLPEAEALNGGYHVLYERNNDTRSLRAMFTHFDSSEVPSIYGFKPQFVGGSHDFSTTVFDANGPLVPEAPAGHSVYESVSGQLSLVNVLPDGSIEPEAQAGGVEEVEGEGEGSPEFSHAVSSDGSRIFWTGLESHPNLYMREDGERTVQLDASQAGGPGGGGKFWTASENGEHVFFTDDASAGLTADTVPGSGANLYEYDVGDGRLTDLTPSAEVYVQGVIGASADGSYVYFVANGALAEGAAPGGCVVSYNGNAARCNLYVTHDGVTTFIAQLSDIDGMETHGYESGAGAPLHGDWREGLGHRTAQVSANGTLVFDSELPLTGYRSYRAVEVYDYSPTSGVAKKLDCVSCSPSEEPLADEGPYAVGGVTPVSNDPAQALRVISGDGSRIFFDTKKPLLPQDSNGWMDVYEWERDGSGTCELPTNCVSLLSGGTAPSNSYLMGTSANGNDVMIVTRAQLVGADRNETYDVYDARVDGTQPPAPAVCSGTGCQGAPPAPPIFATPASVTFAGVGDFPPPSPSPAAKVKKRLTRAQQLAAALRGCQKQHGKRRSACVRGARKRYGATKQTKKVKRTANKTKRSAMKGGK